MNIIKTTKTYSLSLDNNILTWIRFRDGAIQKMAFPSEAKALERARYLPNRQKWNQSAHELARIETFGARNIDRRGVNRNGV